MIAWFLGFSICCLARSPTLAYTCYFQLLFFSGRWHVIRPIYSRDGCGCYSNCMYIVYYIKSFTLQQLQPRYVQCTWTHSKVAEHTFQDILTTSRFQYSKKAENKTISKHWNLIVIASSWLRWALFKRICKIWMWWLNIPANARRLIWYVYVIWKLLTVCVHRTTSRTSIVHVLVLSTPCINRSVLLYVSRFMKNNSRKKCVIGFLVCEVFPLKESSHLCS